MYKVGDKLLCKKEAFNMIGLKVLFNHSTYTIINTTVRRIVVYSPSIKNGINIFKIDDYFYTKEEVRKIKLEKLQCIK